MSSLQDAVSAFGMATKAKLSNPAAQGAPEDQLRAPFEALIKDLSVLAGLPDGVVTPVGEHTLSALATRPDYAVTVHKALVGFIEVKAPGKGADPRKFADPHDKKQWTKLKSLPNLLYTDGNAFSLWRNGELQGKIVALDGDVVTSGAKLEAPPGLVPLIADFLQWTPVAPKSVKVLAATAARLCRLLRDEVTEELDAGNAGLTGLATEWRGLLFPEADNAQFADGYAQAVTFGLLLARAHFPGRRHRPCRAGAAQVELADRDRAAPSDRRRRREEAARQRASGAHSGAGRGRLAVADQGRCRRMALFLRGLSRRL
jgi:hypothetical protein